MGLLGSAFGRGLAGGANAAGDLANKYVDEALAQQRAEAMATLQRKTAGMIRADDDAFRNDPARVERERANRVADEEAIGGVRNRTALEGARAQATDATLQGALTANEVSRNKAATQAKLDTERTETKARGGDNAYLASLRAIEAASRAPDTTDYKGRELDRAVKQMQLDNIKHVDELKKEFGKATPERQKQIQDELSVLSGKDNDKFLPVPLKDEMGNVTGYKVFDTKSGKWADDGGKSDDPMKKAMDKIKAEKAAASGKTDAAKTANGPAATAATAEPAKPEWQPDPNSPVGKQRTLMEQARVKQSAERAGQEQQSAQARQAATQQAERIMASGDKRALFQFQGSDQFKALDFATKAKIAQIINGQ